METPTNSAREFVTGLFWIWVMGALVLTGALVIIGGAYVLEDTAVQIVVGAMALATATFFTRQHRIRNELARDPRLRMARERRGF